MIVKNNILEELIKSIGDETIEVVDLSQTLSENTPVIQLPESLARTAGFKLKQLSKYDEKGPTSYWNDFVAGEHCGTHFDAPIHWISGRDNDSVDRIPLKNMIGQAYVIDISQEAKQNPDYCVTVEDIQLFEERNGSIKEHSWVLIRSGWSNYVSDHEKFYNIGQDGQPHTPGITKEASIFLAEERDILGVGVETVGTDAGIAGTFNPPFPNHHYMHGANKYGLAQLTNLERLPEKGAILIVNPLKIENGSGSPVRVLALVRN
ncbi:cyclase family protein [Cytobacillus kochii]|uniref:cyclase family protein n=1 Tax=Cytobacillus kochii TaxID=859143 RepID=UPI002780A78E|nr:cyclase family protein [Cytobacillus kochii]MDQ0185888.1 kynurenine formamidase [Cytobacillus kochii]